MTMESVMHKLYGNAANRYLDQNGQGTNPTVASKETKHETSNHNTQQPMHNTTRSTNGIDNLLGTSQANGGGIYINSNTSNINEYSEYLQKHIGQELSKALAEVADKRPADPIQYLAVCLRRTAKENNKEDKNNNIMSNHQMRRPRSSSMGQLGQTRPNHNKNEENENIQILRIYEDGHHEVVDEHSGYRGKNDKNSKRKNNTNARLIHDNAHESTSPLFKKTSNQKPKSQLSKSDKNITTNGRQNDHSNLRRWNTEGELTNLKEFPKNQTRNRQQNGRSKNKESKSALNKYESSSDTVLAVSRKTNKRGRDKVANKTSKSESQIQEHSKYMNLLGGSETKLATAAKYFPKDKNGQTELHKAVQAESTTGDKIRKLLGNNNVQMLAERDGQNRTAREVADELDRDDLVTVMDQVVLELIKQGSWEQLGHLVQRGYEPITDILVTADGGEVRTKYDVNVEGGGSAEEEVITLYEHIMLGTDEQQQYVLHLIRMYRDKVSTLHQAIKHGNLRAVQLNLDRRKLAEARDVGGRSSLHVAVLYNWPSIVNFLVANFPETLPLQDNMGRTALHFAVAIDNNVVTETLMEADANRHTKDVKERIPYHFTFFREEVLALREK